MIPALAVFDFVEKSWQVFTTDLKIYWVFALLGSVIFLLQMLLTLFGLGGGHDLDAGSAGGDVGLGEHLDTGFSDFQLFSTRSVIAFIPFFGWGGVLWGQGGLSGFFAACGSGFGMMFATALMFFVLMRLQHSGNINAGDIIGCTGTVYLSIPGGHGAGGKVTVNVKGCTREIKAVAEAEIATGTPVRVTKLVGGDQYQVEKL